MSDWKWKFLATLIAVLVPFFLYLFINPHSSPPETAAPETPIVVLPAVVKTPPRCRRCPHTHPTLHSPAIKPPPVVFPTQPQPNLKPLPVAVPLPATIKPTPIILNPPPPSFPTLPPLSPPPSPAGTAPSGQGMACPIDALKLNGCVNRLAHVRNRGSAKKKCCPVLQGLVGLDAAVCLCTTIKAKLLSISVVFPIALEILVQCGNTPPPGPGFTCHQ